MTTAVAKAPGTALEQRVPPNQSIYIRNLEQKLQQEDLRRELYMLFSTYGPVIDVTAMKSNRMRGQAHVLFRDVHTATQAMRSCQGMDFFGKEMEITYAKTRSRTIAKLTGTFEPPEAAKPDAAASEQQESSFPAPPGTVPQKALPPPPGLQTNGQGLKAPPAAAADAPSPQGVKRAREESDDEGAPMDEDDDEGEMDMSEDDD